MATLETAWIKPGKVGSSKDVTNNAGILVGRVADHGKFPWPETFKAYRFNKDGVLIDTKVFGNEQQALEWAVLGDNCNMFPVW